MILGEHNLVNVSDEGKLLFIRKLNFTPVCFHSFVLGWYWDSHARLINVVISDGAMLFIYENTTLIWTAQLENKPIAIIRSNVYGLAGGLVMLDSKGLLTIDFLGSEPFAFGVQTIKYESVYLENIQEELGALENEIKKSIYLSETKVINTQTEKYVDINITEEEKLTLNASSNYVQNPTCLLRINYKVNANIDQLQFTFSAVEGINCNQKVATYKDILSGFTKKIEVELSYIGNCETHSTKLEIIVSFIDKYNIPRVFTKCHFLPFDLFYKLIPSNHNFTENLMISLSFPAKVNLPGIIEWFDKNQKSTAEVDSKWIFQNIHSGNCFQISTPKINNIR
ncbi:unnamed protein product [Hermetia illucens]|uniref:Uncharacterized protein n=2 Tax=Hermetia illucens TaxID=343691 RepID=A0A7R8UD89_HERIL|nr:unnamed protein product [Hermetia illucens]